MRAALLAAALVIGAAAAARAGDGWPPAAEKRFEEAGKLSNAGEHAKAAAAYREVAEWPEGGDAPWRAQALYCAALQEEQGDQLEKALATYRELLSRFPKSRHASMAQDAIAKLDPAGARGLEFRRRFNEVPWSVLIKGHDAHDHELSPEQRAGLEKARGLLEALLRDHREHPEASSVAVALGETRLRLGDLDGSRAAFEDGVALAKREADKRPGDSVAASNVSQAETQLAEARRALRRRALDRIAKGLLAAALVVLVAARPWRSSPRRLARLAGVLLAVDAVLALGAVALAEYVRRYIDDHSPLEDGAAALLVLLPGLAGVGVSLGIANVARSRRGVALAATIGVLAGLAAAVVVIHANGLFPFLDSEL